MLGKASFKGLSRAFALLMAVVITACGGGSSSSSGGGTPAKAATTTIAGKVTRSANTTTKKSLVAGQIAMKAAQMKILARLKASGKTKAYQRALAAMASSQTNNVLAVTGMHEAPAGMAGAKVELYDATHPEWLYPVSTTLADNTGAYKLGTMDDPPAAPDNPGATYKKGDAIPSGNYTLVASNYDVGTGTLFVATQSIVKNLAGDISGDDLVAQSSTAIATVTSMFGAKAGQNGSFGGSTFSLPANAAIQVTFSMPMARISVLNATSLTSSGATVAGVWRVSPDLLSATFDPTGDLTQGSVYTIKVGGADVADATMQAKNIYGKAISSSVTGTFVAGTVKTTAPTIVAAFASGTDLTKLPISTAIRFATSDVIDTTSGSITSTPSLGDDPNIIFIGKGKDKTNPYVYEISLASSLALNTAYSITYSGGKDMAGNVLSDLVMSFTTESASVGIQTTTASGSTIDQATVDASVAVKGTLAKWVNAFNDLNTSEVVSFMNGDFYYLQDPKHVSSDDLNRDGKLDLNEFTSMLNTFFDSVNQCAMTVTGDLDTNNPTVQGGLALNGSSATIAFNLKFTPGKTGKSCSNKGPNNVIYAELQNVNGQWSFARASDNPFPSTLPSYSLVTLKSPASGDLLDDPSTSKLPAQFTWTGVSGVTSYVVVVIDANDPNMRTGWALSVDGASTSGKSVTAKFTSAKPTKAASGATAVASQKLAESLGINTLMTKLVPGGNYYWAVLGFKTKTTTQLDAGVTNVMSDLGATSSSVPFGTKGTLKEITYSIAKSSDSSAVTSTDGGWSYDAGSENSVAITVTEPAGVTGSGGMIQVYGAASSQFVSIVLSGSPATGTATVPLSMGDNWVSVCDSWDMTNNMCASGSIPKQFAISTTGGATPKVQIDLANVIATTTGANCDVTGTTALASDPNMGSNSFVGDVCKATISGTVDGTVVKVGDTLNINVWTPNGNYFATTTVASGNTYSFTGVEIFKGDTNYISVADQSWLNQSGISVSTTTGFTFVAPIGVTATTSAGALTDNGNSWSAQFDAGSASSVTLVITTASACTGSGCSYWQNDGNWDYIGSGTLTGSSTTLNLTLYNGINNIGFQDDAGNYFMVTITTTGGNVLAVPNKVEGVSDSTTSSGAYLTPATGTFATNDAVVTTADCSVTIIGSSSTVGVSDTTTPISVSIYNSTAGLSAYQQVTATVTAFSTGTYEFSQSVYTGDNIISLFDSFGHWASVTVTSTGACTAPAALSLTSVVTNGGTTTASGSTITADQTGTYLSGDSTGVTITGLSSSGATVMGSIASATGGYSSVTATADANGVFTIDLTLFGGDNWIFLSDGLTSVNATINTTAVINNPINTVKVATGSGTAMSADTGMGGTNTDSWGQWTVTAASGASLTSVTITGDATNVGDGTYYANLAPTTPGVATLTITSSGSDLTQGTYTYVDPACSENGTYTSSSTSTGFAITHTITSATACNPMNMPGTPIDSTAVISGQDMTMTDTAPSMPGMPAIPGIPSVWTAAKTNPTSPVGTWTQPYNATSFSSGTLTVTGGTFSLTLSLPAGFNSIQLYDAMYNPFWIGIQVQ